jgi:CRP-like cAMP-binding protein
MVLSYTSEMLEVSAWHSLTNAHLSAEDIAADAERKDEEKRLTKICQKQSRERDEKDLRFVCQQLQIFSFWNLWPEAVQRELAKVLCTEGRVKHETVISRGSPGGKVFFLISGNLRVSVPANVSSDIPEEHRDKLVSEGVGQVSSSPLPPASEAHFLTGAAPPPRKLATLGKGDTCGEACLLAGPTNPCIAHADVVVSSPGAVMLSLTQGDFLKALKEILGLRHQDRLMYLRSHPLFVNVSLEDLDKASDLLSLSFFAPGTILYPDPSGEGRVYLIAEGECVVKRRKGKVHKEAQERGLTSLYDEDTCSILGKLDLFGLDPPGYSSVPQKEGREGRRSSGFHATDNPSSRPTTSNTTPTSLAPNYLVEAFCQVKSYYISKELFAQLPRSFQMIVEQACSFKNAFLAGRLQSRAQPPSQAISVSPSSSLLPPFESRPVPSVAADAGKTKLGPVLDRLATNQVADLFKAEAAKNTLAAAGLTQGSADQVQRNQSPRYGRRKDASMEPHQDPQPPRTKIISAPLHLLPPSQTTWSRLPLAKKKTVETEQPSEHMSPSALATRHAAVFSSSQRVLNLRPSGRTSTHLQGHKKGSLSGAVSAYHYFDDEDEEIHEAWRRSSGADGEHHSVDRDLRVILAQQSQGSDHSMNQAMNQTLKKPGHGTTEILRIEEATSQSSRRQHSKQSSSREQPSKGAERKGRGRNTPPPSSPLKKNSSLLNDTTVPTPLPSSQQKPRKQVAPPVDEAGVDRYQEQEPQSYSLPASVVLGYESLNPFQWAQLQSYYNKGVGAGDNILPKPKWG